MDANVLRAMARWPNVPAAYGRLRLDRRGNWLLKLPAARFERIANAALRDFMCRNYGADERGRWFFQNGPQRVYVSLDYAPLVLHYEGEALVDHCGRPVQARATYVDDEGSVLMQVERAIGLLDDRDLALFASRHEPPWQELPRVDKSDLQTQFGFVAEPSDSLR
ncbi:MAG: DUF2946 family protein [Burkholderiales bacterium]